MPRRTRARLSRPASLPCAILGSRFVGSREFVDVALRNSINKGVVVGPRMLVATEGIGATGGHFDPTSGFRDFLLDASRTTQMALRMALMKFERRCGLR
mgnify:CR=1 FL=1